MRHKLLVSDSSSGPISINFPTEYIGYFFPKLYPSNIEATLKRLEFDNNDSDKEELTSCQ